MPKDDKEDAIYANFNTEKATYRASGNKGCAIVVVVWLSLLALGCAGWVVAKAFEAWQAAL